MPNEAVIVTRELELRPEVLAFAQLMEAKLRANDHKPGWKNDDPNALCDRVHEEALELAEATAGYGLSRSYAWNFEGLQTEEAYLNKLATVCERVGHEAADVANMAMMVADACGALPIPRHTPDPDGLREALERATYALMEFDINRYLIANVRNSGAEKAERHRDLTESFLRVYAPKWARRDRELYTRIHDATQPLTNNLDQIGLGDDCHFGEKVTRAFHDQFITLARQALDAARVPEEGK